MNEREGRGRDGEGERVKEQIDRHADSINLIPKKMKRLSYHYIFSSKGVISMNKIKFSCVT